MIRRMLAGTGLVLGCSAVLAAEGSIDYAARAGLNYSDNIYRAQSGEQDALALSAGIEASGSRPTGRLRYRGDANLTFNEYLDRGLDSEVIGRAGLTGNYDFVPERFGWNAGLSYGQLRNDVTRPSAPGNRETVFSLSTGPTGTLQLSNVAELQLSGTYARQFYSDRPFDNETLGGRAQLARRFTPRSSVGVGFSYNDVSYVGSNAPTLLDFQRQEYFGRVDLQGVRSEIELEAGQSTISGDLVNSGGFFVRADLSRRITPVVTGFLRAVREYPTSTDSFGLSFDAGQLEDTSLLTAGPRKSTDLSVGLRFNAPRTRASLSVSRREDASLVENVGKRRLSGARGEVTRRFTPRADGSVYASFSDEKFTVFGGSSKETAVGTKLGFTVGRKLGIEVRLGYRDRDASGAWSGYSEFNGGVFLRWTGQTSAEEPAGG